MTPAQLLDADAAAIGLVTALYADGDLYGEMLRILATDDSFPDDAEALIVHRMRCYAARRAAYGTEGLERAALLVATLRSQM